MKIITICGSLRFQKEMLALSEEIELAGNCVLSVIYPTKEIGSYSEAEISMLSQMHRERIKLSNAIFVVNIGGYIGESTRSEIAFAQSLHKEVLYYTDFQNHSTEPNSTFCLA